MKRPTIREQVLTAFHMARHGNENSFLVAQRFLRKFVVRRRGRKKAIVGMSISESGRRAYIRGRNR